MIYPCLFFANVSLRRRLLVGCLFVAIFLCAVTLSQRFEGVPTIRFDAASAAEYIRDNVLAFYDRGPLKVLFGRWLTESSGNRLAQLGIGATMLLISTLGVWSAAAAVMVVVKRRSTPPAVLLFPVLVVANYLVMSLGLARNTSGVAWEDELHNRPLVWAYFAVAVWTAAIAYAHLFGNEPPRSTLGRGVGVLLSDRRSGCSDGLLAQCADLPNVGGFGQLPTDGVGADLSRLGFAIHPLAQSCSRHCPRLSQQQVFGSLGD